MNLIYVVYFNYTGLNLGGRLILNNLTIHAVDESIQQRSGLSSFQIINCVTMMIMVIISMRMSTIYNVLFMTMTHGFY